MKKGDIINISITDLAFGGKGIARTEEGLVVFVDGALPGQTVEAKISLKKRNHAQAKLLKVLERSTEERTTEFQPIPGAPWANLPIETQQKYKQNQVFELFSKMADTDLSAVFDEYVSSPNEWFYRNKMEYSFGPTDESFTLNTDEKKVWTQSGFGLGSKKRGQYWLVENLEKPSGMFDEDFELVLPKIKEFCQVTGKEVYNQRTNTGFFRHLVVRKSFLSDSFLVNLVTTDEAFDIDSFTNLLVDNLGERVAGVLWTKHNGVSDRTNQVGVRTLVYGHPTVMEEINGLLFEMSIDSFFQTNPKSAEKLYSKVASYVDSKAESKILDLFCGTGTIGQILARKLEKVSVTGVEIVPSAVKDARKNVERNKIENVKFVCADVKNFLNSHKESGYETIIIDPPRAGIVPKALQKVLAFGAPNFVYVSCNPATMARDTKVILESGYKLEKFSLVDQFPHTAHVECVGKFVKI
ncbi:23S rRNA (uracil(1939)-C(5))-methyltransferase RlmD [bacterium DOLZORAL124_38_8]|nr:MAG: 23S rRNA (uracil(1939)-C(5))-methyltransferase RlmD [bacterium DOLZORAL124_38_8]